MSRSSPSLSSPVSTCGFTSVRRMHSASCHVMWSICPSGRRGSPDPTRHSRGYASGSLHLSWAIRGLQNLKERHLAPSTEVNKNLWNPRRWRVPSPASHSCAFSSHLCENLSSGARKCPNLVSFRTRGSRRETQDAGIDKLQPGVESQEQMLCFAP